MTKNEPANIICLLLVNYLNEDYNMKHGFTLAEVLVTLGIIGVVSAMTLPTLVKNHQRQVYVTQLQKVYKDLHHSGPGQF